MKRRRAFLNAGALLGLLLGLSCAWLATDRWAGRRAWERYWKTASERGEKLSFHDYFPPAIPPEENFAAGTIFMRTASGDRPLKLPSAKTFSANATLSDHLEATKAAMVEAGWLSRDELFPEPGKAVLFGLRRFQVELDELRAARSRPRCCFLHDPAPPPQTAFTYLSLATDVAALWALRMEAHLLLEKPEEAMEDFLDGVRLYRALIDEPALITGLVRQAVLREVRVGIEYGLIERKWRVEDLIRIDAELAAVDLASDLRWALRSERGFINDASNNLRQMPIAAQEKRAEELDILGEAPTGWRLWLRCYSGSSWREQLLVNRVLDHRLTQVASGLDHFYAKRSPDPELIDVRLTSITGEVMTRDVALEMSLRQTRLVCALERFRTVHHAYPLSLAELVPETTRTLPNDVIDGLPVRYRRLDPESFLLYSVGANARDDAGSAEFDKRIAGSFKAVDWVWGKPWK